MKYAFISQMYYQKPSHDGMGNLGNKKMVNSNVPLYVKDAIKQAIEKDDPNLLQYAPEEVQDFCTSMKFTSNRNGFLLAYVDVKEPLNDDQKEQVEDYLGGQYTDGWGEGFEQQPIEGYYVSFYPKDIHVKFSVTAINKNASMFESKLFRNVLNRTLRENYHTEDENFMDYHAYDEEDYDPDDGNASHSPPPKFNHKYILSICTDVFTNGAQKRLGKLKSNKYSVDCINDARKTVVVRTDSKQGILHFIDDVGDAINIGLYIPDLIDEGSAKVFIDNNDPLTSEEYQQIFKYFI